MFNLYSLFLVDFHKSTRYDLQQVRQFERFQGHCNCTFFRFRSADESARMHKDSIVDSNNFRQFVVTLSAPGFRQRTSKSEIMTNIANIPLPVFKFRGLGNWNSLNTPIRILCISRINYVNDLSGNIILLFEHKQMLFPRARNRQNHNTTTFMNLKAINETH